MYMHLDVNTEIYPMHVGDKFTMALAHTLNLDGTPDTGYYTPVVFLQMKFEFNTLFQSLCCNRILSFWKYSDNHDYYFQGLSLIVAFITSTCYGSANLNYASGRKSLADKYEYIMHGKLYKITDDASGKGLKAEVYVSYGGLLMLLRGEASHVSHFELDQRIFLLMRKL
ncbi:hypothetical protein GOBAR_DD27802 [Gossypium barbadense]|nr:hypothetical protein GOBAR_DD27802 [Gossypium barbadense]